MLFSNPNKENSKLVRILDTSIEEIEKGYESLTNGVNRTLLFADRIKKMALAEIRNAKFSDGQIKMMCDAENGTMIDARYWGNKRMFIWQLTDAVQLDQLDKKWKVKFPILKKKIEKLSESAFLTLHEFIYQFWNESPTYGSPSPNLDEFVKNLQHDKITQ